MNVEVLNKSQYKSVRGTDLKSCPRCSVAAGELVYYPLEDFGSRMMAGDLRPQSYCGPCRSAGVENVTEGAE